MARRSFHYTQRGSVSHAIFPRRRRDVKKLIWSHTRGTTRSPSRRRRGGQEKQQRGVWSSGEQRRRQQRQRRADPTAAQQTKHKKENPDVISVKFSDTRRREKSVLADPLRKHSRDAGMEGGRSGRGRLADPSSSLLFYYYYYYFVCFAATRRGRRKWKNQAGTLSDPSQSCGFWALLLCIVLLAGRH